MSEPFSEEDLEDEVMHSWLDHFDLGFHQLHASGHMSQEELLAMIDTINPEKIFPIHTENPQLCARGLIISIWIIFQLVKSLIVATLHKIIYVFLFIKIFKEL